MLLRQTNAAEAKYTNTELEVAALVYTVQHLKCTYWQITQLCAWTIKVWLQHFFLT